MQVCEQAQMIRNVRPVYIKYICDKINTNIAWKVKVTTKPTKLIKMVPGFTAKQRLTYFSIKLQKWMLHNKGLQLFIKTIRQHKALTYIYRYYTRNRRFCKLCKVRI